MEAVESGAESYASDVQSEGEELSGNAKAQRCVPRSKKSKPASDRLKGKSKKAQQIASEEEEEVQKQNPPARGKRTVTRGAHALGVSGGVVRSGRLRCGRVNGRKPTLTIGRKAAQKRAKPIQEISDSDDQEADEAGPSTKTSKAASASHNDGGSGKMPSAVGRKRPSGGYDYAPTKKNQKKDERATQHAPARDNPIDTEDSDAEDVSRTDPSSPNPPQDPIIYNSQKAMAMLEKICDAIDLKWQGYDISPDSAIWSKIGGTYMRKKHPDYRLTFSAYDSYHTQIGRFLAAMVYHKAGLEPKFLPGGAFVWEHGWFLGRNDDEHTLPKCLHGCEMVIKPRTVELNPSSEAGKRAIADQGASLEKNRYGRQVVVLRFDNNAVCFRDQEHGGFPHPHAHGSCAMVFSDAHKAVSAMRHDIEWTVAMYPNADKKTASERILICGSCNCNYALEVPIGGRQLPKMTPYKLSGIDDISREMYKNRKDMQAHKANPHTMVYTCCNPQSSGGTRGAPKKAEKSCSWRISAMDLRYAYVMANEIYAAVFGKSVPANLQAFKWSDAYAFKTDVISPVNPLDTQDPFA